jgi:hypothetical protein
MDKKIQVVNEEGYNRLVAIAPIKKDEVLHYISGKETKERTKYTIEVLNNEHIDDPFFRYCNHSFDPNVRIELKQVSANRDIKVGEEIKFNYYTTESEICSPFVDKDTGKKVQRLERSYAFNQVYANLLFDIMHRGIEKSDRTGVGTKSIFGANFTLDVSKSFPLLTTKKINPKRTTAIFGMIGLMKMET